MSAANNCCLIQTLYELVLTRVTGTLFDLLGVTAVRLTMTPSGRLFWDLASIIQESHRAFLEVLPSTTFTELAGMQMTLRGLPIHTCPRVASRGLRSSVVGWKLILEFVTWIVSTCWSSLGKLLDVWRSGWAWSLPWWYKVHIWAKIKGWTSLGHVKVSKASNPYTFPNSLYPSRIRLHPITPGVRVLYWDSRTVFGSFTTRNPTDGIRNPSIETSASKYLETGISWLLAAERWNNECASANSSAVQRNKGKMFLLK